MTVDPSTTAPTLPSPPARKPRNVVEMILVRGGILVLVLLAAVQAHARFGYQWSLQKLQTRLAAEDETAVPLLLDDVPKLIVGFPSRKEDEERHWRQVVYQWRGITQTYEIRMPYDSTEAGKPIMSLVTLDAPVPPPEPIVEETSSPEIAHAPQSGPTPGMGGGGMGGGPRPDLMASDADGDGRVSKEEAPERVAANFGDFDTNSDGFIDKDEIAARRARRQAAGGGGRGPGGEGNRPQRPATETEKPVEAKDADKPLDAVPAEETEKPADAAEATKPAAT